MQNFAQFNCKILLQIFLYLYVFLRPSVKTFTSLECLSLLGALVLFRILTCQDPECGQGTRAGRQSCPGLIMLLILHKYHRYNNNGINNNDNI